MTDTRVRLHTAEVADRYGLKPKSLRERKSRGDFPGEDGYDQDGAWWFADTLPTELPSRPKGRPRKTAPDQPAREDAR